MRSQSWESQVSRCSQSVRFHVEHFLYANIFVLHEPWMHWLKAAMTTPQPQLNPALAIHFSFASHPSCSARCRLLNEARSHDFKKAAAFSWLVSCNNCMSPCFPFHTRISHTSQWLSASLNGLASSQLESSVEWCYNCGQRCEGRCQLIVIIINKKKVKRP